MKNVITIFLSSLSFFAYSQETQRAKLLGYSNNGLDAYNEYTYFSSLNKLWNKDIACVAIPHIVYVSFNVDTNANVINLQINELPVYPLPVAMKDYIKRLVESTNGKWMPKIKAGKKVSSTTITYRFDFGKTGLTQEQLLKEKPHPFEYLILEGNKHDFVRRIEDAKETIRIFLGY